MYFFYKFLTFILLPVYLVLALFRVMKKKDDLKSFLNRFGIATVSRPTGEIIWFHVASVGEMLSVKKLVNELSQTHQILLTSFTKNAKIIFPAHFSSGVIHQTICFDNFIFVKLFLSFWKPKKLILVESEIWPSLIFESAKKFEIIFLNAKITEKDCGRWKKFGHFLKEILLQFKIVLPQSKIDLERFKRFYTSNIKYIGNLKYSATINNLNEELVSTIKSKLNGKRIITIASSHPGEELLLLDGIKNILNRNDIFIFLAPRHSNRSAEVIDLLQSRNIDFITRTSKKEIAPSTKIMLVDTLGELNNFYHLSEIALVCGSFNYLVGGHNIIEPAKLHNAIIVGPNMVNFEEMITEFKEKNAVIQLEGISKLEATIDKLLSDEEYRLALETNAFDITESYLDIYPQTKKLIEKEIFTS